MVEPKVRPIHVFALLLFFWCAWLYTEVAEYRDRTKHRAEVDAFMHRGDRFTADDGRQLRKDIVELEQRLDKLYKLEAREHKTLELTKDN